MGGGFAMTDRISLAYRPPGPVAARFMTSSADVQLLNGPIGSGKTTACLIKSVMLACRQRPSSRDGKRKFRVCAVRDTYRQLWKTTLASWFKRFPRTHGDFTGSEGAPATHRLQFPLQDGTIVDFQIDFVAIGDQNAEDVLRGYEVTCFYLNEADLLAKEVYTYARGRAGRYPDMEEGGPSWYGVLMDCNAPELDNWLYQDFWSDLPQGIEVFRQPSGLSAQAENIANLPPGYYATQSSGQPEWYITRMLKNMPGYSRAGKPVYPEFNDALHVDGIILPVPGRKLVIGLDAGLTPAAVICQQDAHGVWLILEELASEPGVGAVRFAARLRQLLNERYAGFEVVAWADPAAAYGVDKVEGEASWIDIVARETGIRIRPAPSNALTRRLEAVRLPLSRLIEGKPGLRLSTRCTTLRHGFNSGYRFRKLQVAGDTRYDESPEKNEYSHPHDALQYALSGGGEDAEVMARAKRGDSSKLPRQAEGDYNPYQGVMR